MTRPARPAPDGPADRPVAVLARFADPSSLRGALLALRREGFTRIESHSPFPLAELPEPADTGRWTIVATAAGGWLLGAALALAIQLWANLDYPLNIGGRPLLAWTAFSLPMIQFATLAAVIGAVGAFLHRCGFPHLSHPVFTVEEFRAASADGFFLSIGREDPIYTAARAAAALRRAGALWVRELPP